MIKKKHILVLFLFITMVTVLHMNSNSKLNSISKKSIQFIDYPDFPSANSTWGSIGYNPATNCVYIGVTNHKNKIGLYEYNTKSDKIELKGFINEMAHLRDYQWQGKIHTKIVFDSNGKVFFGTDGGESMQEYLMNHPEGYTGGFLMAWEQKTNLLTNLGVPMQYESIKDIDIDTETGKLYAITYPQAHFITYDIEKNEQKDFGRLGSSHVPRVLFTDNWGNCYYVDWRQRLVKYEKSSDKLIFATESLPAFEGTPGAVIITGITGYAKDSKSNTIYLVTYGAKMLAFHPLETGIGEVDDLGACYDLADSIIWKPYVPNLNVGHNGKLYYFIGGHGNYVKEGTSVLMELDPKTKQKRIVFEFPTSELSEVTGSGVIDKYGNLYFAGRKMRPKSSETDNLLPTLDDNVSIPFLIKFNPEKELH